jgi:hypothetical protein
MKIKPDPQSASDVERNAYSWNTAANLLFVDQPVGTGFSYSRWPLDYVTNEKQVAQQLYDFLQAFFLQFPQFAGRPLFITGESYAVRALVRASCASDVAVQAHEPYVSIARVWRVRAGALRAGHRMEDRGRQRAGRRAAHQPARHRRRKRAKRHDRAKRHHRTLC